MNAHDFSKIVINRQEECKDILCLKAKEYAGDQDRLENFKRAAGIQGVSPEKALIGMAAKHWVSIVMLIDQGKLGDAYQAMWAEKITDAINYFHLLEGLLKDRKEESNV